MTQSFDHIFLQAQTRHADGDLAQAQQLYRIALQHRPDHAPSHYFLGLTTYQLRRQKDAVDCLRRAIALDPAVPEYHCDLAGILFALNELPDSIAFAQTALQLRADFPEALLILGNACCRSGCFDEGIDAYQRLLVLRPDSGDALNNMGMALFQLGRIEQAVACFARLTQFNPTDAAAASNRIYAMHFSTSTTTGIDRELAAFDAQHAEPLQGERPRHTNDRRRDRPLRIGFLSPDLREHVVGWNMVSWLGHLDRQRFQTFCYSDAAAPDAVTRQLQSCVRTWRDTHHLTDAQLAQLIGQDGIDILVDLAAHTSGNRLLVFARKPAPVQVTYLAYPGSTGLKAIDYRLSDPYLDPNDCQYVERTIHLPKTYWCYRPGGPTPEIVPPQALASGKVTFGCLNQFQKVSAESLELWRAIMAETPDSRLLLHAPVGQHREHLLAQFENRGISPARVELVDRLPWPQYIRLYERIDIALDPFPYGGGITSCDALWMGVPLITLAGSTPVGRSGVSILQNLRLEKFIANSPAEYLTSAVNLAGDLDLLSTLRSGLRQRMLASPLMNGVEFAADMGRAFERMWDAYLKQNISLIQS